MDRKGGFSGQGFWFAALVLLAIAVALLETAYLPSYADPMEMSYVDMARHLARGQGLSTSMIAPYYAPRLPSPISLWPPLYPAAAAALSKLGIPMVGAARLVSILAFGLSVGLVWLLGSMVFNRTVGAISAALLSVWPPVTLIAGSALSESLFVLLVLLSVFVSLPLIRGRQAPLLWYATAAAGGLAMGGAALTRYVGLALILVGAAALVLNIHGKSLRERLATAAVWSACAGIPPVLFLIRNVLVTGSLIGAGRPPEERGVIYHTIYSVKAVGVDALRLLARVTILPEALGLNTRMLALVLLGIAGLFLVGLVRSHRLRGGVLSAVAAPFATPESRFVVSLAAGYWVAMIAAHGFMGFMALSTRMMMPAYPFLLVIAVAMVVALAEMIGPSARRGLAWAAVLLCVGAVVGVIVPRSVAAGGPRLGPTPPPPWVAWVAANTPPNTPIVGNRGSDYNFYLERPVLSFAGYLDYRAGDRFDRDCRKLTSYLTALGWNHAYLVLRAEEGDSRLDADLMGRRYGKTIERLLKGELPLPVRPIAHQPEFIVYEISDLSWTCTGE